VTGADIQGLLAGLRLPLHDEKSTQAAIDRVFTAAGIAFEREKRLDSGSIVDFLIAGVIAVEIKLNAAGGRDIYRQLRRYARFPQIGELVLVTNRAMGLPAAIEGKPVAVVSLGRAWL
jgi:hypothetical protein